MAEVTICIPAWRAAPFIDRTLWFARGQTHAELRILVSIDADADETPDICERHAREDPRIEVHVQEERLGWARNVNFLLDRTESELFFIYFHDDVIAPQYTELLEGALRERPDAAGAHCDMGHFGGTERAAPGASYEGSAAQRLAAFLIASHRGPPLRGLTRTEAIAGGARVPTDAEGMWAGEPYLMRLLVAGPILHVGETLYYRWDQRAGGVTEGWKDRPAEQLVAGLKANARQTLAAIDGAGASERERPVLIFLAYLRSMLRVRTVEERLGTEGLVAPGELHPSFTRLAPPTELAAFGPEVESWAAKRYRRLHGE